MMAIMGRHYWIIGVALLLATPSAAADKQDEAREHFMRGAVKYTEGNIDAALAEFQLAYALNPSYKIRFNIAQCHMEHERFARAYEEFYLYLYEGGDEVPGDRRADVEQTISDLAARLGDDVPDPQQIKAKAVSAQQPVVAAQPQPPVPPPKPAPWKPDPRAADLTLETRPADMPLRDWFGVSERQVRHFEKVRRQRPELDLDDYLVERGSESTGLFVGEIIAAAGIGIGGGMVLGGYLGGGDTGEQVGQAGITIAAGGIIALAVQLIVDVIDVGYPRVGYPERLAAEIEAREDDRPGPSQPGEPAPPTVQPDSKDGPPSEAAAGSEGGA
jgi:hypothetical protein